MMASLWVKIIVFFIFASLVCFAFFSWVFCFCKKMYFQALEGASSTQQGRQVILAAVSIRMVLRVIIILTVT